MSEVYNASDEYGEAAADGGGAGGFVRETEFKLVEVPGSTSHNPHRIRPPGKCVSGDPDRLIKQRIWAWQHRVHWVTYADPVTGQRRSGAYLCTEVVDWERYRDEGGSARAKGSPLPLLVRCDGCRALKLNRQRHDEVEAELKKANATAEQAKELLGPLTTWLKTYTFDDKYRLHTYDWASRAAGRLKLSKSAFAGSKKGGAKVAVGGLTSFIADMMKVGVAGKTFNPVDPKAGIVIDVMRTGSMLNTQVSFAPYRDPSTDTVVFAPITEQMAAAYRQGCVQDLDDPSPAVELTPSQIDEIVRMTEVQDNRGLAAAFKEARKPKREPDARGASQIQVLGRRPADDTAAMNAAMDKVVAAQAAAGAAVAAQVHEAKIAASVAAPATTDAGIAGNLRETVPAAGAAPAGTPAAPIDMAALRAKLGVMLKPKAD